MGRRIVVGLGGNALLRRGQPVEYAVQQRNAVDAAKALASISEGHELVVTHGNGPQVGLLALQSGALEGTASFPLDALGAETEGMIGYLLERELRNRVGEREVVTLLTQTEVDSEDPAYENPTKPIGGILAEEEARRFELRLGWSVGRDGSGFRRLVPSPEPRRILGLEAIELLTSSGCIVICGGGGGIPVVRQNARLRGVEAVVDKDLTTALIADALRADALLLLTDVDAVYRNWDDPKAEPIRRANTSELRKLSLEAGSMGPKVEAACRFVDAVGGFAAIGALDDAAALLSGKTGTVVTPNPDRRNTTVDLR